MLNNASFNNDWVSPTGNTILDLLEVKNISISAFASKIGLSVTEAKSLINSEIELNDEIAERLSIALGPSKNFWINRESQFRNDVATNSNSESYFQAGDKWLQLLPVNDLIDKNWISNAKSTSDKIRACLKFFNVTSIPEWNKNNEEKLASYAFRKSNAHTQVFGATVTWLTQAEIVASEVETEKLDLDLFREKLSEIRSLTRQPDPQIFLPKLKEICALCGVALAIVKTPEGCRASGAAKLISPDKAILILSFRFLKDDQFWFSFFHEAAHLILHGNQITFENDYLSLQESEANDFAYVTLIPKEYQDELKMLPTNHRAIIRYSRKLDISRGIVVGQLQKLGRLKYGQFNNLKTKYDWFSLTS